jgi:hypothetical protein
MGYFMDILTGRLFNFRNAKGSDVNVGISDKLIITPKALIESDLFSNTSIPLVLPSVFSTKSGLYIQNTSVFVIPTNGYYFLNRKQKIKTQLFAYTVVENGLVGELCIIDISTNSIVANSVTLFNNTTYGCIAGNNLIELDAGKAYCIALRRVSGNSSKLVSVRAATLTLKLVSL